MSRVKLTIQILLIRLTILFFPYADMQSPLGLNLRLAILTFKSSWLMKIVHYPAGHNKT